MTLFEILEQTFHAVVVTKSSGTINLDFAVATL